MKDLVDKNGKICVMDSFHVDEVVSVHMVAFSNFFLTFLGERFLRELYFGIINDPSGIAYVYEMEDVIGFVAGTDHPEGFFRRLLSNRWYRFGFASIGPVLRRPSIIPRLIRAFNTPKEAATNGKCGTLMSIAVIPAAQGKGIGKQLVRTFLSEAERRGLNKINLTTDLINNDSVNRFYLNFGFQLLRTFVTPEGRAMNEYGIDLK